VNAFLFPRPFLARGADRHPFLLCPTTFLFLFKGSSFFFRSSMTECLCPALPLVILAALRRSPPLFTASYGIFGLVKSMSGLTLSPWFSSRLFQRCLPFCLSYLEMSPEIWSPLVKPRKMFLSASCLSFCGLCSIRRTYFFNLFFAN